MPGKMDFLTSSDGSFIQDLILRFRLIWRLMADRRVHFLVKLIPILGLIYVISPIDLIPGAVLPLIGALDDATVIWLTSTLFFNLCPEEIVRQHSDALHHVVTADWQESPVPGARLESPHKDKTNEIVDVEAKDAS